MTSLIIGNGTKEGITTKEDIEKRNRNSCKKFSLGSIKSVEIHKIIPCGGGVCNLVISVDCSLNYSHHKYNTKLYNRVKEME